MARSRHQGPHLAAHPDLGRDPALSHRRAEAHDTLAQSCATPDRLRYRLVMLGAGRCGAHAVVATDLDGTLLRSDGGLSPLTAETFQALSRSGVSIVLVTARPFEATRTIAVGVGARTAICLSGAVTYDVSSGTVLDKAPLGFRQIGMLRAEVSGVCEHVACGYETMHGRHVDPSWDLRLRGLATERLTCLLQGHQPPGECVLSVLLSCGLHQSACLETWAATATTRWGAAFSPVSGIVEVTARSATKAAALARLCHRNGVAASDVVACGDSLNDMTMIRWAGLGIAVASGHHQLRAVADLVADDNDADGIARALADLYYSLLHDSSPTTSASSRLHQIGAAI